MQLPETAQWPPLQAAELYRNLAEEAAGMYANAFNEYSRLKNEYQRQQYTASLGQQRRGRTTAAIAYTWKETDTAKSLASDVGTYALRAQVMAAMAAMKYAEHAARAKDFTEYTEA